MSAENPEKKLVSYAAKAITNGKTIIYPTDTVYGIGCSINSPDSVLKVYSLKNRDLDKPLSIAFPDLETAKKYVLLSLKEEEFIKQRLGKPYTFIALKRENVPDNVTPGLDTVGIRIIDHQVVKQIITTAGVPIVTTSANISGKKAPVEYSEIDKVLLDNVDIAIDSGRCRIGTPSKIVDLRTGKILR
jgi:L-threonylcarbamoyladenylate synthase